MEEMALFAGIGGLIVLTVVVGIAKLIRVCAPNEVLIFYGTHRTVQGKTLGYRLVHGGRGVRKPLLERVTRMDLTNMIIELRVQGAYSKGGIPLNVDGVANVKVASDEATMANAIERFLDKSRQDLMNVARETLEGNLRGVLATLTPEEVNQDREKFADALLKEAGVDLQALGMELDTLKVQNISDDKGYLDSIGRRQTAELLMRSRVAEAEAKATADEASAAAVQRQEIARVEADIATARAEAQRRIVDAETKGVAMIAEQRGQVTSAVARAEAEVNVQRARMEQVRLQMIADHIKPAEANRQQMEEAARGAAAKVIEDGKATASALRDIAKTWNSAGDHARQILVAQKLNGLVSTLMSTVGEVKVDKVTFIDNDLTQGDNLAVKAAVTSEQIKHTMGVDVPGLLNRLGGKKDGPPPIPR